MVRNCKYINIWKIFKKKETQNKSIHKKMLEMQTAGKKQRLSMANIVMVSVIIEQRKMEKRKTYIFFADAVQCFEKLWFQDCIIELAKLGHNKNDLEILYKLNETAQVKINTPYKQRKWRTGDNIWIHYVLCINSKSKWNCLKSNM